MEGAYVLGTVAGSNRIPISPSVMSWARRSAGFADIATAAKRLGTSEATVVKWEAGDLEPTITQLRAVAKLYRRPLAVLLLDEPPVGYDVLHDFRGDPARREAWSPALHTEYRRAISQREVYLELLQIAPDAVVASERPPLASEAQDAEALGAVLRQWIGPAPPVGGPGSDEYRPLRLWQDAAEAKGILVLHTRDVSPKEMRGFAIAEWPFPVIALNGADSPRGRLFTLAHELAHLLVRSAGLCDLYQAFDLEALERKCNDIAGAALMPVDAVLANPAVRHAPLERQWTIHELREMGRAFGTSGEAFLVRLVKLGKATWALYRRRRQEFEEEYEEAKERQREERRRLSSGGPSYYRVKVRDLGRTYVGSVLTAFRERAISSLDVADYLEIRFDQLPKLEKELAMR